MAVVLSGVSIPPEVLHDIAYHVVAHRPLGPPSSLLPLLLTSKALNAALSLNSTPALYARIFALKFDTRAIARRAYTPHSPHYADQLVQWCRVLRVIRAGDVEDEDAQDALLGAYVMLLESDGRNRAQLEQWARVELFVERFVRSEQGWVRTREGWPVDCIANACALWIMWMFTTKEKLLAETPAQRAELISIILPYVLVPVRYPSAYFPPTHFTLPLTSTASSTTSSSLLQFSIPTPHGPYPLYTRLSPSTTSPSPSKPTPTPYFTPHAFPHFSSLPPLAPPLSTTPAKLLFIARREATPFHIPPHFPETRADVPPLVEINERGEQVVRERVVPTKEDIREVNAHCGARFVQGGRWDWEVGRAVGGGRGGGGEGEGESRRWDCDWWRMRLCADPTASRPRYMPGRVYEPGCMSGLWQGRLLYPSEPVLSALFNTSHPPSTPAMRDEIARSAYTHPIYMRLREHHLVASGEEGMVPLGEMQNAHFEGHMGGVVFAPTAAASSSGLKSDREHVKITIDGRLASSSSSDPYAAPSYDAWRGMGSGSEKSYIYETYDAARKGAHDYLRDEGACRGCVEREEVVEGVRRAEGMAVDDDDEDGEGVEWIWESVGLARRSWRRSTDEEEEEDEDAMEIVNDIPIDSLDLDIIPSSSTTSDFDDSTLNHNYTYAYNFEGDDLPNGQPAIYNADGSVHSACTRRVHDPRKVVQCDGVRDVVVSGETDKKHAQAWNAYTFYGRIRPWDGLIGILRVSRGAARDHILLYGYLVGGEGGSFVGNWRVAGAAPDVPGFESAVVMSRREE